MKVTTLLKTWLNDHAGLSADETSDEAYTKAAGSALADGSLTPTQLVELTKDPDAEKAVTMKDQLDQILAGQKAVLAAAAAPPVTEVKAVETGQAKIAEGAAKMPTELSEAMAGSDQAESATTRVDHVSVQKMYSTTRSEAHFPTHNSSGHKHWNSGARLFEGGSGPSWKGMNRFIDAPSELDLAISGAHFKKLLECEMHGKSFVPRALQMTDHDELLWRWALENVKWGGVIHGVGTEDPEGIGVQNKMLTPGQQKAVLDDSVSFGLEIAPIVFDDAMILTPLLHGEFFPRVNVVNITRGRRIEGASIGTVTLTSGGADATDIPLFGTANYITAFDTTIHVCNGAIELGMDFMSDSPVDLGSIVSQQYGQVLLQWLDEQVNVGDGTTEPEGVMNASGTTSISASNGNTGPPLVGDYEGLLFGINKPFKQGFANNRITFGGTEQSYQRSRSIAVGSTDERRVFGMDHESYTLLNHPYGIGEFFANTQLNFVNWGRYRMYRRLGLGIKVTTEGQTLVRGNLMMISARARYGGQIETGSAAAVTTNAQS